MYARLSALGASIALVLVLGVTLLPVFAPGGGAEPTPSPSPSPAAEASPTEPIETPLPAGTYSLEDFPVGVSFTVGEGWFRCESSRFEQGVCREQGHGEVKFLIVVNVVADPCAEALRDPPVGPSVDDLVSAISGFSGFTATAPIDRTVDGFAGKELTVTAPGVAGCTLRTWATPDRINGVGDGEANIIRIVDVDGTRVVMTGPYSPIAADAPQVIALIEQLMDSVTFTP